jgi:hypothetical protein
MAASTGALAAERARLEREIETLSKGLPPEAAQIVQAADALMAQHAQQITALKAARDAIDAKFGVERREAVEAEAKARALVVERHCSEIAAAQAEVLDAVDEAEGHLKAYVAAVNRAYAAEARRRSAANAMAGGVRLSMTVSLGKQYVTGRLVGGHCAHTAKVAAIDAVGRTWGTLTLIDYAHYPATMSWREREESATAADVQRLIDHAREG